MDLKEEGLKIVRQSLLFTVPPEAVLTALFAPTARVCNIEQQLLSMFGDTDGKRDAMLRFTNR